MVWICLVCSEEATYIVDTPSSKLRKDNTYGVHRRGFCEKHKPKVWTIAQYEEDMRRRDDAMKLTNRLK